MSESRTRPTQTARLAGAALLLAGLAGSAGAAGVVEPSEVALPTVGPQEPGREGTPGAEADDRSRPQRRVLHLADGRLLRVRCRWSGTSWEVQRQSQGEWVALPSGSVERAVSEKGLESQVRALRRELEPDDLARRCALVEWMMREGLREEAFGELDQILGIDPDQARALELLARWEPGVLLPGVPRGGSPLDAEARKRLLELGTVATPSVREIAIRCLQRRCDAPVLRTTLAEALLAPSHGLRGFAALALRRTLPGEELPALTSRSILDGSREVRAEACRALRDVGQEGVILPALRALESEYPQVAANAAEALGMMGFPAAVQPLMSRLAALGAASPGVAAASPAANIFIGRQIAYVADFDVEIAQAASIADPVVRVQGEGTVLDVRVHGIHWQRVVLGGSIRRSLEQLTGEKPGSTDRAWLKWWKENEHEWARESRPAPAPSTRGGR